MTGSHRQVALAVLGLLVLSPVASAGALRGSRELNSEYESGRLQAQLEGALDEAQLEKALEGEIEELEYEYMGVEYECAPVLSRATRPASS